MSFSTTTTGRAWMVTVQIANMCKAGLTEDQYMSPEFVADFFISRWENSGKNRTAAIAVCQSANGCYHCHMSLYGNTTTLKKVSEILFDSHVEPQLGGKKELQSYLLKEPPYDEKNEQVLLTKGLENIQDRQGQRCDLDEIQKMIDAGMTPNDVFCTSIHAVKYSKVVLQYYYLKRKRETPLKRQVTVTWHVGKSGCGKSYCHVELAMKYGEDSVYLLTDYRNGGFDMYNGEPILFLDEFKGELSYAEFLVLLDRYRSQIHARYTNIVALWTEIHIASIYPPEEIYSSMVDRNNRNYDSFDQFMRRLDTITYHYKDGKEFKRFSLPASEYKDYKNLIQRATGNKDGFIPLNEKNKTPFDQK